MQSKHTSTIKILGYPGPSGSRIYRMEQIFKYLNRTGKYQCVISPNAINDEELMWADIIFPQHVVDPRMLADVWAYKIERGKKVITDLDDTIEYKEDSPFYKRNKENNAKPWQRSLIEISDLVTVTTKPLYEEARQFSTNVHILPNYLDMEKWNIGTTPNETGKIRIGYNCSITHRPDFEMILPIIKNILKKYKNVIFLTCGDDYLNNLLNDMDPKQHEYIQAIPDYVRWPQLGHTLGYDIAVAPLVESHFNRCKSWLKYLEYGMFKSPGIYSPAAYKDIIKDGKNGFIAHDLKEWEKYLSLLIENPELRRKIRKYAYKDVVKNHSIEKNIWRWDNLYQSLFNLA